jgi:hypothetical protein
MTTKASKKNIPKKIETKTQYDALMASINNIMQKGEKNLTAKELTKYTMDWKSIGLNTVD